jgi:hypothetical protein
MEISPIKIDEIYRKLVQNFFRDKYVNTLGKSLIFRNEVEQNLLLAFILFGQDEMAYVFLRIVKVNILLIFCDYFIAYVDWRLRTIRFKLL